MPQMMQMQQHYQDKMINAVLNHIKAGMNDRAPDLFLPSYETTLIHAFDRTCSRLLVMKTFLSMCQGEHLGRVGGTVLRSVRSK
eukprot:scaffold96529_cov78-Cyclotella_meneghiniana.AAC.11